MTRRILFVTNHPERWEEWISHLQQHPEAAFSFATTFPEAGDRMKTERYGIGDLIILDETIDNRSAIDAAKEIILSNVWVSLALVNALDEDAFHEAAEGLGILCRIPPGASAADADELMRKLLTISR